MKRQTYVKRWIAIAETFQECHGCLGLRDIEMGLCQSNLFLSIMHVKEPIGREYRITVPLSMCLASHVWSVLQQRVVKLPRRERANIGMHTILNAQQVHGGGR